MATDFDWEGFRALAGRLDSLLAGEATLADDDTFAEACRRALAFLYTAGVSMPPAGDVFEDAGGDSFWEGKLGASDAELDPASVESEIENIASALIESVVELQGDLDEEELEDVLTIAARALWDVREALGAGTEHYDAKRLHEAAWEWSFGFDEWGAHALTATSSLHDALWGAR